MKNEELAFLNQQLACMLNEGIPLEGAIEQLCRTMRRGDLKEELEVLGRDLANGIPIDDALGFRKKLPPFYKQMLKVGVKGNNLPAMLTLVADYYRSQNLLRTRLLGVMIYPLIVLVVCGLLSGALSLVTTNMLEEGSNLFSGLWLTSSESAVVPLSFLVRVWGVTALMALVFVSTMVVLTIPKTRNYLNWKLPGFREANLTRFAQSMHLLLKSGVSLKESIDFLKALEPCGTVKAELKCWSDRFENGVGKFDEISEGSKVIPPLFCWLVGNGGEDVTAGFKQAGEVYAARASFKTDILIQAALPVSILALGMLISSQVLPYVQLITKQMEMF